MLRILISFVLSLVLTMSPILGQQFKNLQDARTASNAAVVSDKPAEEQNAAPAALREPNARYKYTYQNGNNKTSAGSVNTGIVYADNENPADSEPDVQPTEQSKPAAVKPDQVPAEQNKPVSTESSAPVIQQKKKNLTSSEPASAGAEQIKTAAVQTTAQPSEISSEQNDPIPAGSGTAPAGQTAPAQEPSAPESTAAPVPQTPAPSADGKVIDTSMVNTGLVGIRYLNQSGKKLKLLVEKDDARYTYNLKGDNSLETFPLQSGNGEYKISIMENTEGNRYRYVLTDTISVNVGNANAAYLNSIQMINWNKDMAAIKKAAELTSGVTQEEEKVKKIYNFIVSNIRYDTSKLSNLPSTYLPVIDDTLKSGLGICYDFASLNAAMLRSVGIPAKLVMGYAEGVNGYHAWNKVYIGGKWVTIDISYDSQMREMGGSYSMKKDSSKYQSEKEY